MEHAEGDESDGEKDRRVTVKTNADGAENVAAIELSGGQKIEGSGKDADPSGATDGMKQESAGGDTRMEQGGDQSQQEGRAKGKVDALHVGEAGNNFCVPYAVGQGWDGENESYERAGGADVEECARSADWGTNEDERAKCADEGRKGNEERIAGANVMMAAGEEMAEFVGQENGEQCEGEGEAGGEARGMLVEEFEGAHKFVEGDGLVLRVGDGELRAGDEAGAEREEEENACEEQGLWGRARRDVCVLELLRRDGAPIEVERNGGRRIFWEWSGHEILRAMKLIGTYKYNTGSNDRASARGLREKVGLLF
jgi:hypothetical protein